MQNESHKRQSVLKLMKTALRCSRILERDVCFLRTGVPSFAVISGLACTTSWSGKTIRHNVQLT